MGKLKGELSLAILIQILLIFHKALSEPPEVVTFGPRKTAALKL